jgi:hypothetical protein
MDNYYLDTGKTNRRLAKFIAIAIAVAVILAVTIVVIALNRPSNNDVGDIKLTVAPRVTATANSSLDVLLGDQIKFEANASLDDNIDTTGIAFEYKWQLFNAQESDGGDIVADESQNLATGDWSTNNTYNYTAGFSQALFDVGNGDVGVFFVRVVSRATLNNATSPEGKSNLLQVNVDGSSVDIEDIKPEITRTRSAAWWLRSNDLDINKEGTTFIVDESDSSTEIKLGTQFLNLTKGNGALKDAKSLSLNVKENPLKKDGDYLTLDIAFDNSDNTMYNGNVRLQLARVDDANGVAEYWYYIFHKGEHGVGNLATDAQGIKANGTRLSSYPSSGSFVVEFVKTINNNEFAIDININGEQLGSALIPEFNDGSDINTVDIGGFRSLTLRGFDATFPGESMGNVYMVVTNLTFVG